MASTKLQARRANDGHEAKWRPFAGLRARKERDEPTPEINFAAGLNRVLQSHSSAQKARPKHDAKPFHDALAAIEGALYVIDQLHEVLAQANDVALAARAVQDAGQRALLAETYDELRLKINEALDNLDTDAARLLGRARKAFSVPLGDKTAYTISPSRLDISAAGLNLTPPREAFSALEEIAATMGELDAASVKLERVAAGYCRDAQYLITKMGALRAGVEQAR